MEYYPRNIEKNLDKWLDRKEIILMKGPQRGLKDEYSAFIRGHQVYHNYIRPHQSLYGRTPAEVANLNLELGNCKWESLLMQSVKNESKIE